jgi:hypothetical protein
MTALPKSTPRPAAGAPAGGRARMRFLPRVRACELIAAGLLDAGEHDPSSWVYPVVVVRDPARAGAGEAGRQPAGVRT